VLCFILPYIVLKNTSEQRTRLDLVYEYIYYYYFRWHSLGYEGEEGMETLRWTTSE